MKPQEKEINVKEYLELDKNLKSELYEVGIILQNNFIISELLLDKNEKKINIFGKSYASENDESINHRYKISLFGELYDQGPVYTILKDGTLWYTNEYNNWIINGDTASYKYKDPLNSAEKTDFNKWIKKFKSLYEEASYVYLFSSDYFFKINNEWFIVADTLKESPMDFRKQYPAKEDQDVRMVKLKDQFPDLYVSPADRDTSLIKQIKYTSTFFEKSDRGDAFNYSAGWWYFDIYMPGGDTLKIKRFASFRDPEMKLYKIPKELGGREDVLFIIQEPNEIHPEQVGGMYVIRPKNYKETPQYKEQEAKELEKEKKQKQKESQEAVRKRRNFLPEE